MKKIILSISVLALLASCGSGDKKKDTPKSDTTKTDTTAVVDNTPKVKDYAYYRDNFKAFKLEGVELSQFNFYEDTANKMVNIIYRVGDPATAGYDEIILTASTCKLLIGEDRKRCDEFTLESFTSSMNEGMKNKMTASEYKSGDVSFYYCTNKNIKGSMGAKDFNQMIIQGKVGEFKLDGRVNVFDLKSDMVKAEAGLKKVADYLAK